MGTTGSQFFIIPVAIIFALGILIFFHELGHFLSAKKVKVKVEKFSIGFGPALISKEVLGTRYSINAIPFGGFVKLAGENIEEIKGEDYEFLSRPWYQRILISISGPVMNYVLGFLLFLAVIFIWGVTVVSDEPRVGSVIKGMPAEDAGIKAGDRIISIDDVEIKSWRQMAEIIHGSKDKILRIVFERDGREHTVFIIPKYDEKLGKSLIGISPKTVIKKPSIINGIIQCMALTAAVPITSVSYLIEKITKLEKPELAGPIGIVSIIAKSARGGLRDFLYMLGVISSLVGFFNLLPIPILDGGHIMLSLVEGVSRRKLSKKMLKISNAIGMVILLSIIVLATRDDLVRLFFK